MVPLNHEALFTSQEVCLQARVSVRHVPAMPLPNLLPGLLLLLLLPAGLLLQLWLLLLFPLALLLVPAQEAAAAIQSRVGAARLPVRCLQTAAANTQRADTGLLHPFTGANHSVPFPPLPPWGKTHT